MCDDEKHNTEGKSHDTINNNNYIQWESLALHTQSLICRENFHKIADRLANNVLNIKIMFDIICNCLCKNPLC